jgi:hypothetical protein
MSSSEMRHRVPVVRTYVSEELVFSKLKAKIITKLGITLAVTR